MKKRCKWVSADPLYERYHDEEWGRPVHDDRTLFEFLTLEGAQAGLSWITVLRKRENYRKALKNFDPKKVAAMDWRPLMKNEGLVRNKLKCQSIVGNAKAFLKVQGEFGSFDKYVWAFDDAKTLSKDLKKRGFRFIGPTIVYAFMQATGMVNDHDAQCFLSA